MRETSYPETIGQFSASEPIIFSRFAADEVADEVFHDVDMLAQGVICDKSVQK